MNLKSALCQTALFLALAGPLAANGSGDPMQALAGSKAPLSGAAASALTVENFDPQAVNQLIDKAPVDDSQKELLKQGVQAAGDNPEALQAALDQVKAALGM